MQDERSLLNAGYRRTHERIECNLVARLRVDRFEVNCRIVNLSQAGAGIVLSSMIHLLPGSRAVLVSQEIGELSSTVRWGSDVRYGLEFSQSSRESRNLQKALAEL